MTSAHNVEDGLLDSFDRALDSLAQTADTNIDFLRNLNSTLKAIIVRHPYISGYLGGHFPLTTHELLQYISHVLAPSEGRQSSSRLKIDYSNRIVIPTLDDGRNWISSYSATQLHGIIDRIEAALDNLSTISESARAFVDSYIWCVSVRRDTVKPETFGTYTFQTFPGFLLICNPHAAHVDLLLVEETMLHEAIHCFLDLVEARGTNILRDDRKRNTLVESPWTGNCLNIHTAFHAILVWFGLGMYFRRCVEMDTSNTRRSRSISRYDFVRTGFRSDEFRLLTDALDEVCNDGPSDVLSQIAYTDWKDLS